MKRFLFPVLLSSLTAILFSLSLASAHAQTRGPEGSGDGDGDSDDPKIQVGAGMYKDSEAQLAMVKVTFSGVEGARATYLQVSAEAVLGSRDGQGSPMELEVTITPRQSKKVNGLSYVNLPMSYKRDVELGYGRSATVELVGVRMEAESDDHGKDLVEPFAELALNTVGYTYMRMIDGRTFGGTRYGSGEIEGGLAFNLSKTTKVRVSFGVEGSAAYGRWSSTPGYALSTQHAVFNIIELMHRVGSLQYTLFAKTEKETLDFSHTTDPYRKSETNLRIGASIGRR